MDSNQEKINLEIFQPNLRVVLMAKNFRQMVRVAFFMLKKSFSKGKLLLHLKYMMMKRSKIAWKAIHNLIYHSSSSIATTSISHDDDDGELPFPAPLDEYEFSCSNSPAAKYPTFLHPFLKRKSNNRSSLTEDDFAAHAVIKALEMLKSEAVASPALPGFGSSPAAVRQLRITDSPFPLMDGEEDSHVDEAAEEFIDNFYKNLRRQNAMASN